MRMSRILASCLVALAAVPARADRGALTVEAGPALSALTLGPPAGSGARLMGTTAMVQLGARYGVSHWLEVGVRGFWENAAPYYHDNTTVTTADGVFTGQLASRTSCWGAAATVRVVRGTVWRWFAGADLGFAQRSYSRLDLVDVSGPSGPRSFGLGLPDATRMSALVAPYAGLEWVAGDHLTFSLAGRAAVELGRPSPVGFEVPLTIGFTWFPF